MCMLDFYRLVSSSNIAFVGVLLYWWADSSRELTRELTWEVGIM